MGCVLCNITNTEYFDNDKNKERNVFYCDTDEEKQEFLEELASDIAIRHPSLVKRINEIVHKNVRAGQ